MCNKQSLDDSIDDVVWLLFMAPTIKTDNGYTRVSEREREKYKQEGIKKEKVQEQEPVRDKIRIFYKIELNT